MPLCVSLRKKQVFRFEEDELIELGDNHIGQFLGDNYAVFKDVRWKMFVSKRARLRM